MQYIRRGKWFCHFQKMFEIREYEELRYLSQQFQFGIYSVLTVRQYQTHNIQYFAARDSFSLYRITVLFRPNKQWGVVWKLSICNFLVMTSHQQLMEDLFISGVASVLLHPRQVKVPLAASLRVAFLFCLREREGGEGLGEAFSHWVRNKLNFFMDSKHWLDIYDQGQPFWFQLAQALRHTEQSIYTHAHSHTHTHIAYIHSRTYSHTELCMHAKYVLRPSML